MFYNDMFQLKELSKTLCFKLIPVGKTSSNLENMIAKDKERAKYYSTVKELIDSETRVAIEESFDGLRLDWMPLYLHLQNRQRDRNWESEFNKLRTGYVKEMDSCMKKSTRLKELKGKNVIPYLLSIPEISEEEKTAVETFQDFTVYFVGFQQNRENIFSKEPISTSLYYRIVDDNFFIFIRNMDSIKIIVEKASDIIKKVESNLKEHGKISLDSDLIEDFFTVNSYNNFMLQKGIELYNTVLGGFVDNDVKVTGLLEEINLYNQKNPKDKLPNLINLKKQILAETEKNPIFDPITNNEDLLNKINGLVDFVEKENFDKRLDNFINSIDAADSRKMYISNVGLTRLSTFKFSYFGELRDRLKAEMENEILKNKKSGKLSKKEEQEIKSLLGIQEENKRTPKPKTLNIGELESLLEGQDISIKEIYKELLMSAAEREKAGYDSLKQIINSLSNKNVKEKRNVAVIKTFMGSMNDILQILKLIGPKNQLDIDDSFYSIYFELVDILQENNILLNQVRNYVTKVGFSREKIKINFDIPTLADGWSKTKEQANRTVIFRKDDMYYLGVMRPKRKIDFDDSTIDDECYEKMDYYLFPGPNKMLPKCMFTKDVKEHFKVSNDDYSLDTDSFEKPFTVSKELFDVYQDDAANGKKKFQKDYLRDNPEDIEGYRNALNTAIDGCKSFLEVYKTTKVFDFSKLKNASDYDNIQDFYRSVAKDAYKVEFREISTKVVDKYVENGDMLLFQIYNKDFSPNKRGKDNLHTIYWKALFSEENLEQNTLRLAGNAEVFYRAKSIEDPVVHKKGDLIVNKTYEEDGARKSIPDEIIMEINNWIQSGKSSELSDEARAICQKAEFRELEYDIIKDRRYTVDQFEFHVPIKFNAECVEKNIDYLVQEKIKHTKDINIIGIDRGERNLLYVTVIDKDGNILEQKSLNQINGIDYHQKLDSKEKERQGARKSWTTIEGIKNIKEGYVAAAVHEIVLLAEKYNALIVMENLNVGFKRGRFGIEKQVYQKIETMLSNKLSYLVNKDYEYNEPGGALKGYQLAKPIDIVDEVGNMNGIVLYVPAGYTSKIDPVSGFVNVFNFREIKTLSDRKDFISKMDSIRYDKSRDMFVYSFNYDNFRTFQTVSITNWDVYTNGDRIETFRDNTGHWQYRNIVLTDRLKSSLLEENIELIDNKDYREDITLSETLVNEFYYGFKLAVQLRNSKPESVTNTRESDYIISPIMSEGKFYDSRYSSRNLPKDADSNGAYNIAKKGLYLVKRFWKSKDTNFDPIIKNAEWFEYVQKKRMI